MPASTVIKLQCLVRPAPKQTIDRAARCLGKILDVKPAEIRISKNLESSYKTWIEPTRFFAASTDCEMAWTPLELFDQMQGTSSNRAYESIREQIFAVALCDMRCLLDNQIPTKADSFIARAIYECDQTKNSFSTVLATVRMYMSFGGRMKEIADQLGGLGALVVMPSGLLSCRECVPSDLSWGCC